MGNKEGIAVKFMLIVSGISLILFAALTLVIIQTAWRAQLHQSEMFKGVIRELLDQEKQTLGDELMKKGQSIAGLMALSAAPLILSYDFDALQRLADNAMKDSSIVYATFFGKDGKPLTRSAERQDADLKRIEQKIIFENEEIGSLELGQSLAVIKTKQAEEATRNRKLATQTDASMRTVERELLVAVLCGAIMGEIALCLAIFFSLRRYVVKPVEHVAAGLIRGAYEVTDSSRQLEIAGQELAAGAADQAASLAETTSSLEELLAMSRKNAENSRDGDNLMREAQAVVEQANNSMARQTEAMEAISRASEETSKIIKTIDEIAFQTNLLALNAAVEAARAGEAGAGFAVVADEVRNLAVRAAAAAKDTENLVAGIVRQVQEGADHVRQTNEEFEQMSEKIARVGRLVTEIAAASQEQTVGFGEISSAMLSIDNVTQRTAARAEESAGGAVELYAQAEKLQEYVGQLLSLIGKTRQQRAAHELTGDRQETVCGQVTSFPDSSEERLKKLPGPLSSVETTGANNF